MKKISKGKRKRSRTIVIRRHGLVTTGVLRDKPDLDQLAEALVEAVHKKRSDA